MRASRMTIAGLSIALLAAASFGIQEGYKLFRTAKAGATNKYTIEANMEFMGAPAKFSATLVEKVLKVEENGDILLEQSTSDAKVSLGGNDRPMADSVSTSKYRANGEVLEINSPEANDANLRREFLNSMIMPDEPIKTGTKWTREYKASKLNGNTPGKGEYECLGPQKVGDAEAIAVKYTYAETSGDAPASAAGTVWISPKDGSMLKAEISYKAAPIPDVGPVDMTVVIKKVG